MFYKIVERRNAQGGRFLYVKVKYWETQQAFARDDDPYLIEDFGMQYGGDLTTDNPAVTIERNIEELWAGAAASGYRGDHSNTENPELPAVSNGVVIRKATRIHIPDKDKIVRDDEDPKGILADPEVAAMLGKGHNRPDAPAPKAKVQGVAP